VQSEVSFISIAQVTPKWVCSRKRKSYI